MTIDASSASGPEGERVAAQQEYDRLSAELEQLRAGGTAEDRTAEEQRDHEMELERLLADAVRRLDAANRATGAAPVDRGAAPVTSEEAHSDLSPDASR